MLPLFTVTIFLGAVLVFGVQPIAARLLLPSFGGSPAVWSATSVFFQVALLAGYSYSFLLTRTLAPRRQPLVHVLALAAPLVFLPLSLPLMSTPGGTNPALTVLGILALGLGVPFTVAATTGPLLQRWFSYTGHRAGRDPYFLYAASNAGSLIVLLSYPFLIEPRLDLGSQSATWSIGYLVFAALSTVCAITVLRAAPEVVDAEPDGRPAEFDALAAAPTWTTRGRWVVLAAVPSALSLGATGYISTDIAAVPLLWIAPLSLYLLSFIVAFSPRIRVTSGQVGGVLPWVAAAVVIPSGGLLSLPTTVVIALHLGFLLVAATMCHTRLAEERPAPQHLTEFYLLAAVGGALGGIFVSLVAPQIFDRVWEYPIAIGVALLLRPAGARLMNRRWLIGIALGVLAALTVAGIALQAAISSAIAPFAIAVALLLILVAIAPVRPLLAALAFAILAGSAWGAGAAIHAERTFFGVYRVTQDGSDHLLVHGSTVHGLQHRDPARTRTPSAYYHRSGPIGQLMAARSDDLERVAVLGLGVGTLAAYSEPGQLFTFYEIDRAMVDIARDPALFTFLDEARGTIETIVADGRLGLAADERSYDLVVLDAFTSDAIPVHLLTREALAAYAERLTPDGIIVMNVSNRFLDLEPAVAAVARSLGMTALVQRDTEVSDAQRADGKTSSTWMVVAPEPSRLQDLVEDPRWSEARMDEDVHPWSDDFSDILSVLR